MGWLELLPLLRRLLPLLGRLTPLVETYVAARGATAAEAQSTQEIVARLTAQMQSNAEAALSDRIALRESFDRQQAQLTAITSEVRQLRVAQEEAAAQTAAAAVQIKALASSLRTIVTLLIVALLLCAGTLAAILLHHA